MAPKKVRKEKEIKLKDWIFGFGNDPRFGVDEVTREPVVFADEEHTSVVTKFPWRRSGDVLTILTNPDAFSADAVTTARRRWTEYTEDIDRQKRTSDEGYRRAERALLVAWREYEGAKPPTAEHRRAIHNAEARMAECESALCEVGLRAAIREAIEQYQEQPNAPPITAKIVREALPPKIVSSYSRRDLATVVTAMFERMGNAEGEQRPEYDPPKREFMTLTDTREEVDTIVYAPMMIRYRILPLESVSATP